MLVGDNPNLSCSIPAVFWLCLYAFPSVAFVYLYQLTFFVACIVLDQRRIQSNKRDILICVTYKPKGKPEEPAADEQEDGDSDSSSESQIENERQKLFEGWMRAYAEVLLRPWVKAVVVAIFLSFAGLCAYSASQMTQEFSFTEVVPDDSYLIDVTGALENYASETIFSPSCYFRNVDQSNTTIQDQMVHYVDQMVAMEYISRPPNHFWVDDFRAFVNSSDIEDELFEAQMDAFLSNDVYFDLYREKIDRDESGRVIMSRVALFMDKVNEKDVNEQVDVLMEQREISLSQPVNQGADEFAFFTYEDAYNIWEFYAVAVDELILTTVIGIVVMSGIALFFVPHWTAVLFVFPTVSLLYVDLLGILQWGNVHINAVMYVCLVISIGLLVDFVLHMTIRYYECEGNRREKTIKMLETMGVSILVGGISTFLGTLPLAFSTSSIFYTVFLSFLALVVTGIGHSLVLLPVVLSTVGPEDEVPHSSNLSMSFRDTTARSMLADES
uniref:SSD domain-containing protein n=1 Tax=Entomoneis paludosa TaxID=265537 RepID=A0A7S2YTK4_9STRA